MNKIYLIKENTDAYEFLKHKLNIDDAEISFGKHGKPYFKNLPNVYFNISHSGKLQAVALGDSEMGVDIELIRKADLRIAKRRFTANEYAYIAEQDCDNRFFEIWTKKEAYLKYKGTGISGGLNSFDVFKISPKIKTYKTNEYFISVCSESDFILEVLK